MKKVIILGVALSGIFLTACSKNTDKQITKNTDKTSMVDKNGKTVQPKNSVEKVDFPTAEKYEEALNNGTDTVDKTVIFTADKIIPDGELGYTIWSGQHLNFISTDVLGWKTGETHTVKVNKVTSSIGSFMITFTVVK